MSEPIEYAQGGYIPASAPALVTLHPDECLIKNAWPAVCVRAGHPTPTSDCTRESWITHQSEESTRP